MFILETNMNTITNIQNPQIQIYPMPVAKQINFCGAAPVEKLGKDVFVGVRDKLIQETAFFREPEILEFVKDYITTALKHKSEINIIDGACSKGYETYSLAMLLDKSGKKVNITGFDIGQEAIEDAKVNSALNNIGNTLFFAGDMKDILTQEFINTHGRPDVIITDPPRAGMHDNVIQTILFAEPERIVYVSCNPATQARDLNALNAKYAVKGVQPVDMFPHTHHVENVTLLVKK